MRSNTIHKILHVILLAFSVATVAACLSYFCGIKYFLLATTPKNDNRAITYAVAFLLFMCNMLFVFSFALKMYDRRIVKILAWYAPIWIVCQLCAPGHIINSTIIPLLYCNAVSIWTDKSITNLKQVNIRYCKLLVAAAFYQLVSMVFKLQMHPQIYTGDVSVTAQIIYSVDAILFLAIICLMAWKGDENNAELELDFCTEHVCNAQNGSQDCRNQESVDWYKSLDPKDKVKITAALTGIQIAQMAVVIAVCAIGNVLLELAVILPMFWIVRKILKKSWHADSVALCTTVSTILFYAACKITIPLKYSLCVPILIGAAVACGLHAVACYAENYKLLQQNKAEKFCCKTATEEQLRAQCLKVGFSQEKTEFAVQAFYYKVPRKQLIVSKTDTLDGVKCKISRMKKALEKS